MRKHITWVRALSATAVVFITLGASMSEAQVSRELRRRNMQQLKPGKARAPQSTTKNDERKDDGKSRMCEGRERLLETTKTRAASYHGELAGVDAEIAQLQDRIRELTKERSRLKSQARNLDRKVSRDEARYKKDCAEDLNCSRYETIVTSLDSQSQGLEHELQAVRDETSDTYRKVSTLRRTIEPLRDEYSKLQCTELVAGETAQSTIDRCAAIFSEWNRRQAELNRYNGLLPDLRNRYEMVLSQINALDHRAATAETYMTKNCSNNSKMQTVKVVRGRHNNASTLGGEIKKLATEIGDLKKMKITVNVR